MAENSEQTHVVRITADTTGVTTSLDDASRRLNSFESLARRIGGSFSNAGKEFANMFRGNGANQFTRSMREIDRAFDNFDMKKVRSEYDKTIKKLENLEYRQKRMNATGKNPRTEGYRSTMYDLAMTRRQLRSLNNAVSESLTTQIQRTKQYMEEIAHMRVPTEEYERLDKKVAQAARSLEDLRYRQQALTQNYDITKSDRYTKLQLEIDETSQHIRQLQDVMKFKKNDMSQSSLNESAENIVELQQRLAHLRNEQNQLTPDAVVRETREWQNMQRQIDRAEIALKGYKTEQATLTVQRKATTSGVATEEYDKARQQLKEYETELQRVQVNTKKHMSTIRNIVTTAGGHIQNIFVRIGHSIHKPIGDGFRRARRHTRRGVSDILKDFRLLHKNTKDTSGLANDIAKSMTNAIHVFRGYIRRLAMSSIFNETKNNMISLATISPRFNKAVSDMIDSTHQFGAQLVAALEPVVSTLGPIFSKIIDAMTRGADAMSQFLARITGNEKYLKAIKGQSNFAASLDDTATSANRANKAVKSYNATVLSFDELHKLDGDDDDGIIGIDKAKIENEITKADALNALADRIRDAFLKEDWTRLGKEIAGGINMAFGWLSKTVGWSKNADKLSESLQNLIDVANGFVDGLDSTEIGKSVGDAINTLINGFYMINDPEKGINFTRIGQQISNAFMNMTRTIQWKKLGSGFINGIQNIIKGINGALDSQITDETTGEILSLGQVIGRALNDLFTGAIGSLSPDDWGSFIANLINNLCDILIEFLSDTQNVSRLAKSLAQTINSAVRQIDSTKLAQALSSLANALVTAVCDFFTELDWTAIWNSLYSTLSSNQLDWKAVLSALGIVALGALLSSTLSGNISNGIVTAVVAGLAIIAPMIAKMIDDIKYINNSMKQEANQIKLSDFGDADFSNVSAWKSGLGGAIESGMAQLFHTGGKQTDKMINAMLMSRNTGKAFADANKNYVMMGDNMFRSQEFVDQVLHNGRIEVDDKGTTVAVTQQMKDLAEQLIAEGKAVRESESVRQKAIETQQKELQNMYLLSDTYSETDRSTRGLSSSFKDTTLAVSDFGIKLSGISDDLSNDINSIIQTDYGDGGRSTRTYIPHYAQGGIVGDGQLFYANEGGVAELIGNDGKGNTAVVNNEQIIKAVVTGVKQGVTEAMMMVSNTGSSQPAERGGDIVLRVDSEELARAVNTGQSKINRRGNHTLAFV